MTKGELMNMLVGYAKEYAEDAPNSTLRNEHMNELKRDNYYVVPSRITTDAVIVDFVNFIGMRQGMDLGFYTKDLYDISISPEEYLNYAV